MPIGEETIAPGLNKMEISKVTIFAKLILCPFIGILFFLMPIFHEGKWTILMGIISSQLNDWIGDNMYLYTLPLFIGSSIISLVYYLLPTHTALKLPFSRYLIASHWIWVVLSSIGGIVSYSELAQSGRWIKIPV